MAVDSYFKPRFNSGDFAEKSCLPKIQGLDTLVIILVVFVILILLGVFFMFRRKKSNCCSTNADCANKCQEWNLTMGDCNCVSGECTFVPQNPSNIPYSSEIQSNPRIVNQEETHTNDNSQEEFIEYETRMFGKSLIVKEKFLEDNGQLESLFVDNEKSRALPEDKLMPTIVKDTKSLTQQPFGSSVQMAQL